PVTMIASSFSFLGKQVENRRYSPSRDHRRARSGLWITARSGPTRRPRTPETISSWTSRCSDVISSTEGRGRRAIYNSRESVVRRQSQFPQDLVGVLA